MALPGFQSSDAGVPRSRFRAPVLAGSISEGGSSGGPVPIVGGFIPVQSAQAVPTSAASPILNQVVSTLAASVAVASFVYIPQTTGAIATSSFASAASPPGYTSVGAALIWDAGNARLGVYSTASGSGVWLFTRAANSTSTAAGAGVFTSS